MYFIAALYMALTSANPKIYLLLLYWVLMFVPVLVALTPEGWPPTQTDFFITVGSIALGLVASINLLGYYKSYLIKFIPLAFVGLYCFILIFIMYIKQKHS